jgi:hypothetical protein
MDAGATQFHNLVSKRFIRRELKLTLTVVTEIGLRHWSGLKTIGADHFPGSDVLDDEMVADRIEFIEIMAARIGGLQAFVQFDIENLKAQTEGGQSVTLIGSVSNRILPVAKVDDAATFVIVDWCVNWRSNSHRFTPCDKSHNSSLWSRAPRSLRPARRVQLELF